MKSRQQTMALGLRTTGFTLIELLVVISVIALLVAILVPCLQAARRQAGAVSCQARLRQWGLAFKMYTDENGGRWMSPRTYWIKATLSFWSTTSKDIDYLSGSEATIIIPKRCITLCPMTRKGKMSPFHALLYDVSWTGSTIKSIPVSYGFNGWLFSEQNIDIDRAPPSWGTCNVKGVANIPVLGDGGPCSVWPYHTDLPPGSDMPVLTSWMQQCINRHNGGINILFMDWSVRKVGLKELWTLKWSRDFNTAGSWTKAGGVKPEDWPEWMRRFKDY